MLDKTNYYASTAFDSTNIRCMPPRIPVEKFDFPNRMRRKRLLPWGIFFSDHRGLVNGSMVKDLQKGIFDKEDFPYHKKIEISTIANPWVAVDSLRKMVGFIVLALAFALVLAAFSNIEMLKSSDVWIGTGVTIFIYLILYVVRNQMPYRNNPVFNRRTGLVKIPKGKNKGAYVIRFEECDAYVYSDLSRSGFTYYHLVIAHRYSKQWVPIPTPFSNLSQCNLYWEFLQHFMDVSQPIPDLPQVEPYRHLDPVTAEYDKTHNRPKDYWRNRDPKEVSNEYTETRNRAEKFSFGAMQDKMSPYLTADPLDNIQEAPSIGPEEYLAQSAQ